MRLFIAISLPEVVKVKIDTAVYAMKSQVKSGRFTSRKNLHITLRFLGEMDEKDLPELKQAMDQVVQGTRSFELALSKLDYFDKKNKKILFFGVKGSLDALQGLKQRMDAELSKIGIDVEQRPYTPHITLARQVSAGGELDARPPDVSFKVLGITLMHSTRVDGQLTYLPIYSSPFAWEELIVERIEGGIALLESADGEVVRLDAAVLPPGSCEGSVLQRRSDGFTLDTERTRMRQQQAKCKLDGLKLNINE